MTASGRTVAPCRLTLRDLLVEVAAGEQARTSSRTRRSCTSPQAPRTVDALRALARVAVSERSDSVERLTAVSRSPSSPNWSDAVALERPDLPLDPADGVAQGTRAGAAVASSTSRAASRSRRARAGRRARPRPRPSGRGGVERTHSPASSAPEGAR